MTDTKKDVADMMKKLKEIEAEMTSKKMMQEIGDFAKDLIVKRTRLGFGVDAPKGRKKKLEKLSPEYVKQRKRNKPAGPTTPGKSNLTRSGDMLDDMEADASDGTVKIGPSTKLSKDKAGWVSEDRPFNNLSKAELKQIEQELDKIAKEKANKTK